MVWDKTSGISISFEYYLFTVQQCSRVAFKIALRVSNMSLHRVQLRVLNGDSNIETDNAPNMKGTWGRNVASWMKSYFKLHCQVIPTTNRLHLYDNYTCQDVYDSYRSKMCTFNDIYVTYYQLTRLWTSQFSNVIIPWKVRMGYCSICANLKSMVKGVKIVTIKQQRRRMLINSCYKTIKKPKH